MKQFYTVLLVTFFALATNAQSLIPGSVTEDPNNMAVLTQRFSANTQRKAAIRQEVYAGPYDVTVASKTKKVNFSLQKTIEFKISFNAATGVFSNTTNIKDDSGKVVAHAVTVTPINRFLAAEKAATLHSMNFMELELALGSDSVSAAVSNLKLNSKDITGSYVGVHGASIYWYLMAPDFANNFELSGTISQQGAFTAADDSDLVAFNFGYSRTTTVPQRSVFWGDIKVAQNGNKNMINWTTEKERDNQRFIVEKGTDGINFNGIGMLNGAGTTTMPSEYNFSDADQTEGTAYYRIKQVDANGHYNYSSVVVASNNAVVTVDAVAQVSYKAATENQGNALATNTLGK
jgi:hypothetical protein